jgi:DNA (cytosine-5)-methyltransferase 1
VLSVEKYAAAYQTLLLRTFFRQFRPGRAPEKYYQYLRGGLTTRALFEAFPKQGTPAAARCLHLEMGPQSARSLYAQIERNLTTYPPWILIGGPPCQAYSVVGRSWRARVDRREFEQDERHTLYREYLRILARYKPAVFIMENVKGLLSATLSGASTFDRVKADLSSPSLALRAHATAARSQSRKREYSVLSFAHSTSDPDDLSPGDYVIEAEQFGIPQKRHRVILLGVRSDLCSDVGWPSLRPSAPPLVGQIISDLHALRSQLSDRKETASSWVEKIRSEFSQMQSLKADPRVLAQMRTALRELPRVSAIG